MQRTTRSAALALRNAMRKLLYAQHNASVHTTSRSPWSGGGRAAAAAVEKEPKPPQSDNGFVYARVAFLLR
jgi:hypothetical protein